MSSEQQTLADVKAEIAKLPPKDREEVMHFYHSFRALIVAGGTLAAVAVALIGAEMAAEE